VDDNDRSITCKSKSNVIKQLFDFDSISSSCKIFVMDGELSNENDDIQYCLKTLNDT
jgi:hypothetical protein